MSEYQYYEFQAVDRPLTEREMAALRAISTRAAITATRFTNVYHWGDLKADPWKLLRTYFDAFLYVANWGSHWLGFRLPAGVLDADRLSPYQAAETFDVRRRGAHVVLRFCCDEEEAEDWQEGEGWLASLVPLRADLLRGDLRAAYLAWLVDVQNGRVEDGPEPPVPPGLAELSAPLKALADFLRVDGDLLDAAAEASAPLPERTPPSGKQWKAWLASIPPPEKDAMLRRVASGDPAVGWELQQAFRRHCEARGASKAEDARRLRDVGELLAARDQRQRERRQRAAAKRTRLERAKAAARQKHLRQLRGREAAIRRKVAALIATTQQKNYDEAVRLLVDLRDAAALDGHEDAFAVHLAALRSKHARKTTLLGRLDRAGL